jgi:flagellar FliL protein
MSESEPIPAEEAAPAPAGKPWLKKVKVAGILTLMVLIQCFLASMWLPHGEENKAVASSKVDAPAAEPAHHVPTERDRTEIDLGAFNLTVFNPRLNNNLLIDFHLYGTVTGAPESEGEKKEPAASEEDDAAKLEKLLKGHKHRFRDQVIVTVRNAQINDLTDPGLGLLKRQILAKTNTLLGEPLVKEVIFSDFVVVEQ